GAGVMGHGIAQVSAVAGFEVIVRDIAQEFLDKAMRNVERGLKRLVDRGRMAEDAAQAALGRISMTLDLSEAVSEADLVVEAVPESLDLKRRVWREVSERAREDAVLATNTSSLSITSIAEAVSKPERFVGMHFFNPPAVMRLVEVIPGARTSRETVELVEALAERMGKRPVAVKRDAPGFIVNRVLITYLNEAAKLLESRDWTKEQIDSAMQHRAGMPLGPFMLADLIGLDIVYNILKVFEENLGSEYRPARPIETLFQGGKLGRKRGEGFYTYEERPRVPEEGGEGFDVNLLLRPLIDEAVKVVEEGIADRGAVDTAMKLGANLPRGPFEMAGDVLRRPGG
ncbi:MAG: 3-hydroxyacyl-CoA dehydrogenase NAD-binding domain-containing protein, partial [Candidatus Bathyarchaeia archaeon]